MGLDAIYITGVFSNLLMRDIPAFMGSKSTDVLWKQKCYVLYIVYLFY